MHTVGVLASLGTDRPGTITPELLDGMTLDTTTAVIELELAGLWRREGDEYTVAGDELDSLLRIIDDQLRGLAADCTRFGGHLVAEDQPRFCVRCMTELE